MTKIIFTFSNNGLAVLNISQFKCVNHTNN